MHLCLLIMLSLFTACSTHSRVDSGGVASIVKRRTGNDVCWNEESKVAPSVQELIKNDLTVHSAVQIALLNNPVIQATFEEIGIAHADLIQAGLFQNPFFEGFVRFPNNHSVRSNTEFSLAQSFLDIFLIPLRKKVARTDLKKTQLRVANAIIQLSFEVQEHFYQLVAAEKTQKNLQILVEAYDAALQLASGQKDQGNINDFEYLTRSNDYLEATVEATANLQQIKRLREKMNQLLGITSGAIAWNISQDFPGVTDEPDIQALEAIALSDRLEVQILRSEAERVTQLAMTKKWWAYTDATLGASTETDIGGGRVTGPTFSTGIPLFNYGQADRCRLSALYRQSQEQLKALKVQVMSEVRTAFDQVLINRRLVETYQKQILPLQKDKVSISLRMYNVMGLGVYRLLEAVQQDVRTHIQYTVALRNYWLSKVALERSLGGKV